MWGQCGPCLWALGSRPLLFLPVWRGIYFCVFAGHLPISQDELTPFALLFWCWASHLRTLTPLSRLISPNTVDCDCIEFVGSSGDTRHCPDIRLLCLRVWKTQSPAHLQMVFHVLYQSGQFWLIPRYLMNSTHVANGIFFKIIFSSWHCWGREMVWTSVGPICVAEIDHVSVNPTGFCSR